MKTWQRAFSIRLGVGGFMEFAVRREEYSLINTEKDHLFLNNSFNLLLIYLSNQNDVFRMLISNIF